MSDWTDELKEQVSARYLEEMEAFEEEDRGNHSTEVCKALAEEFEKTQNGVRIILMNMGTYIKKPDSAAKSSSSGGTGTKRVSKAQAQDDLKTAIQAFDNELVDEDIIDKMSGKACQYFTGVIQKMAMSQ